MAPLLSVNCRLRLSDPLKSAVAKTRSLLALACTSIARDRLLIAGGVTLVAAVPYLNKPMASSA